VSGKLRILVVDDSVIMRKAVSDVIASDSRFEVVGTAASGRIALQKFPILQPHALTVDIEMDDIDGIETIREIRKTNTTIPIIVVSTLTERGAAKTMQAFAVGATDCVAKPANTTDPESWRAALAKQLLPALSQLEVQSQRPLPTPSIPPGPRRLRPGPVEIVAIASSTGGPVALGTLLAGLPKLKVPVVVTQHMPPIFTRLLAERLSASSGQEVREAADGDVIRPGVVYIAPGDYHLVLVREGLHVKATLDKGPPENSCRPAADVMFRSVASIYGGCSLAVVLTGMGYDGLRGVEVLRAKGADVIAQNAASSVVWGMPGAIARANLADLVLPIEEVAPAIIRRIGSTAAPAANKGATR
jgi:two-component system chemotaxis response regulator CheB